MNTTEKQTEKSVAYPKSSQKTFAAKRKKKKSHNSRVQKLTYQNKVNRQENPCKTSKKKRKKTSNNKT